MKIENYGVGGRCKEAMQRLTRMDGRGEIPVWVSRIILLPIPTARDKVHITGTEKLLSEVISGLGEGDAVFGYAIPREDVETATSRGARVFDASESEEFLHKNAVISALGALGYVMTEFEKTVKDMNIGIIGYGRIGKELTRLLLILGARVRVYTSNNTTRIELGEYGVESVYTDYKSKISTSGLDILINTAPTDLSECIDITESSARIIELASGNNFGDIGGVVRLMSIPDRMYPKSAGAAYAETIEKFLSEDMTE